MAATVSYDDATRRATLDPSADLNADAECRVTLTGGIVDLVKNPPATTTWKFRTGLPVEPCDSRGEHGAIDDGRWPCRGRTSIMGP